MSGKVTAIKQQRTDPNRVSVFIEGTYAFSLNLDQLLESKLKKGEVISADSQQYYEELSTEGKLKQRALEWILMRPHSTKEFRDYIYRKKIEPDLGSAWVDEFTSKKYLNDEYFAEWFAQMRSRKSKSSLEIVNELVAKGIARELAQEKVKLFVDERESLQRLVGRLRNKTAYKDEQKLKAYLFRKGFSSDEIREVLS